MNIDEDIRSRLSEIRLELEVLDRRARLLRIEAEYIQKICPHNKRKQWTNNDGDGRFTVERCEICGLQKDGGLDV